MLLFIAKKAIGCIDFGTNRLRDMYLHGLRHFISEAKAVGGVGMPSFCSANDVVCETVIEYATRRNLPVLIEATSNQVNQFGGYCNMVPAAFKAFVFAIAAKAGISPDRLLLGGDHLGPLPWRHLRAEEAMANAHTLVYDFVRAGYVKIHLDTSVHLGDDDPRRTLDDTVIARRGAELYQTAIRAYHDLRRETPEAQRPVFIIGSEVPPAGGVQADDAFEITSPEALAGTLEAYRTEFNALGLDDAWRDDVIAVVVHPGVEFFNHGIHAYDRKATRSLSDFIRGVPGLVLEAHSTDYQPVRLMREMVEDGVGIMKVGPALTCALLEALQGLAHIEDTLIDDENRRSNFFRILDDEMDREKKHWSAYYRGTDKDIALSKQYSFFDRRRYYLTRPSVRAAQKTLLENIDAVSVPPGMIRQYLPLQYRRFWETGRPWKALDMVKDYISLTVEDYYASCGLLKPC